MLFAHLADLTLDLIAIERPNYFRVANPHADPVACDWESCCCHTLTADLDLQKSNQRRKLRTALESIFSSPDFAALHSS